MCLLLLFRLLVLVSVLMLNKEELQDFGRKLEESPTDQKISASILL